MGPMKMSPRISHRYYSDYVGSSLKANEIVFSLFFLLESEAWGPKPEEAWVFHWGLTFVMVDVFPFRYNLYVLFYLDNLDHVYVFSFYDLDL